MFNPYSAPEPACIMPPGPELTPLLTGAAFPVCGAAGADVYKRQLRILADVVHELLQRAILVDDLLGHAVAHDGHARKLSLIHI